MLRTISRPSTARCTLPMYIGFLMSEPKSANCTRLSELMGISHDSVNRFLLRESYEPQDLFNEAKASLNLEGGTLSVDDSTLDKPYSQHMGFVGYFWSGKHHKVVKGISLISLYYTDTQGRHLPVNYRVYDKSEGKTKNNYFQDMLAEVLTWGIKPALVTGDSWYSCVNNLKKVKNHLMGFMFGIESNRTVSIQKGKWIQVQKLDIPEQGLSVFLRDFGEVKLFCKRLKNQLHHYIIYLPSTNKLIIFNRENFLEQHAKHWNIEQYHRAIKQVCNIERFQVRSKVAIHNHLFAALCGYVHLYRLKAADIISNIYRLQPNLFKTVLASFITKFTSNKDYLNPYFKKSVNA